MRTVKPAEEPPEEQKDVVTITGSRIQTSTFNSASAMTVVTTEEADVQGVTDIASLLQNSVAAAGSSQTTAAISSAIAAPPGGLGTQTLSLRGLGAQRTLILLNGRRAGPAGTGGSVGPFDLNVLPLSAVERVEILKDGASSLYGSDAIAGVVNIITKMDSSSSIDLSYTSPEKGAGEELQVSATWGKEFDQGYFRISADYYHQKEFDRGDRDYFFCGQNYFFNPDGTRADLFDPRTNDYTCRDDVIWGHNWTYDYGGDSSPVDANGFRHRPWQGTIGRYQYDYSGTLGQYLLPFNGSNPAPSGLVNPAGWYPVGYSNLVAGGLPDPIFDPYARNSAAVEDFYHPFMNDITLSPEIERLSVVAAGEYAISDSITLYGEALLNRRSTREDGYSQIYTFQYLYTYGGDVFGDPVAIDNGWTLRDDPLSYYYVFLSPTAITDHADQKVSIDYVRVVGGARGDFGPTMPNWTWDFAAQFSRSDGVYKEDIFWVDAITDYELRSDLCAGTLTRYRGAPCVDINWYSPAFNNGELTQQEQDFLYGQTRSRTVYEQTTLEGYMTGPLFKLPAGDVGAVFGFMYQDDSILDRPADAWLDQEVWDGRPSRRGITTGNDDTRAAYVEFSVPLLKDLPFFESLELSLSGRYTDVASYGADSTWKAGLSWAVTDELRFRGSQGTSFRAPGLYELYLAEQISSFAQNGDPCAQWGNKLALGQITQRMADNCRIDPKFPGGIGPTQLSTGGITATVYTSGGYGTLVAETSESRSLGVVWAPEFLGDLQISVDYFDIIVEGEVGRVTNAYILRNCYDSASFPNDPLCSLFSRKQPGELPPGPIKEIFNNYLNIAAQTSRGVDVEAHYGLEIPWGDLDFTLRATRQLEAGEQLLPGSPFNDDNGEAGQPEWVANLNSTFTVGSWSAFWGVRYVDATSELDDFTTANPNQPYTFLGNPVNYVLSTPPAFYHSLSLGYDFENLGMSARFGVRNVLDEKPPMTSSNAGYLRQGNSVIESQYDLYGRTYFVNVTKTF
ncbi:MAG: TonB-dependent receptor [Hyphomonadaceae bacterium]|nr:TonB-dependent receptor [Hyphomonadaceae bacterium]